MQTPEGDAPASQQASIPMPQDLPPAVQDRIRDILDGKTESSKEHVRDTITDFVQLKQQREQILDGLTKTRNTAQALGTELAMVNGGINKCIRDVVRWELNFKQPKQATKPKGKPAAKRKPRRRTKSRD